MNDLDVKAAPDTQTAAPSIQLHADWLELRAPEIAAVDSHAHVFARHLPLAAVRRHAPDYDATLDAYVAHLKSNGISHGVLVQPSFLGTDNSFLLAATKRYPRRFRGVAVVDVDISEHELEELDQCGVVGIRLNLIGLSLPDLRTGAWPRLLARVNALRWHIEVHRQAADLQVVVDALLSQGCTVVVDHFGRPDPHAGASDPGFRYLLSTADSGRVWVKLSAAYRSAPGSDGLALGKALTDRLLGAFGEQRLVWGSDWPHTQHEELIDYPSSFEALEAWVPDASRRRSILTSSACALFRIP
jgi:predicted TIM-barrel fold metal-dependent hydrolase